MGTEEPILQTVYFVLASTLLGKLVWIALK